MCKELRESGLPDPEYQVESFMLRCTVKAADVGKVLGPESGVQSGVQSEMAISVLQALVSSPIGKSEIAKALGKSGRTRYLNDLMKRLLSDELVEYTLPAKPNSRLQKYRLTHKGRALL